jgi:predicted DNA-binding protein (UPF0251 family)
VAAFFKPSGVPLRQLKGVVLPLEGLEAIRLADVDGLDQETAARMMGISRPTFSRLVSEARNTVGRALVNGWAIRIEGGDYKMVEGPRPDWGWGGRGRGRRFRGGAG